MGRKPIRSTPAVEAEVQHEALRADAKAHDVLTQITEGYEADRDLANQMLGQIQMARAISKFTDVVSLSKLKSIKENKVYRALTGQKAFDANGVEITDVGTWVGFCAALGVSASKVDEDLTNLREFGEEALEQMQRCGIGYREMRQFRKLPEDQKTALIELAKTGNKEEFEEFAETVIERQHKEKQALEAQLAELTETAEARQKLLKASNAERDALKEKALRPFKPKNGSAGRTEEDQAALNELVEATNAIDVHFERLGGVVADLAAHDRAAMRERALQAVQYLVTRMREVVVSNGLDVRADDETLCGRPAWLDGSEPA